MPLDTSFLRPSQILAPYVAYYFVVEAPAPGPDEPPHTVNVLPVPHLQLVFAYGEPSTERQPGGTPVPSPDYALTGYMSQPIEYACAGHLGVIMVGLQPWGLRSFLRGPVPEIIDRNLPLSELFRGADQVEQQVRGAASVEERIAHIEAFLVRNLRQPALDQPVVEAVEILMEQRGATPFEELATGAGLSVRQFRRRFGVTVGLDLRRFSQLVRFQATFEALDRQPEAPDWTAIALEAGFYDQSHFINAFRSFTGISPAAYLRQTMRSKTGLEFDAALDPADPAKRMYE